MDNPHASNGHPALADILDSLGDPVVAFDREWRYTFVSRRAADALGKPAEELLGRSMFDLFPDDRDTEFREACQRAWSEGKPVTVERCSSVLGIWVEQSIYPFEYGATSQWRDITERKVSVEAHKRENELLQGIVDNIPIMLCLYDPKLNTLKLNREFERVLGWTAGDTEGSDLMAKVYPDPAYRTMAADYMNSLAPGWKEFSLVARDGSQIPSEWANVRLSDSRIIGIGIDVRARHQAEASLGRSEERYRALFDNSLDAVFLTRNDGRIVAANPAACAMFGMSVQEICRRGRVGLIDTHDPRLRAGIERRRLAGHARGELTFIRGDGSTFEGDVSSVVVDDGGRAFVIVRDITEQKRDQEALRRSEERFRALVNASSYGSAQESDKATRKASFLRKGTSASLKRCGQTTGRGFWDGLDTGSIAWRLTSRARASSCG